MFVPDFDADIARLKANADGIGGFVKCAGEALHISLRTMADIRRFEDKQNRSPDKRKYHVGQRVRITKGPFELWEAEIERVDSRYRLSVLVNALGGLSSLQLDEDQVEAV